MAMTTVAIITAIAPLINDIGALASSNISKVITTFPKLQSSLMNIQTHLIHIQQYLERTDQHDHDNNLTSIKAVVNLSYKIHDLVEECKYIIGNKRIDRKRDYVKRLVKEPKFHGDLKHVAEKIEKVEKEIVTLREARDLWEPSATLGTNSSHSNDQSQHDVISSHSTNEDELVGMEEHRETLVRWLRSEISIISVWGMGGIGKTTLVGNVYKREKKKFNSHAWVTISQKYSVIDLLRKLISEITREERGVPINTSTMELRELKEKIIELLGEKKYLIVLDDVWVPKAFHEIDDVFVNNNRGSKIIITTQKEEVAFIAGENHRLKLKPLDSSESWKLFCRKAFPGDRNNICPQNLKKWGSQIVDKCEGLPLVIVSIGSLLNGRERTEIAWKHVHDQLSSEFQNNPNLDHVRNILNLSFRDLQGDLKNCFLYCCMFPEDHPLARKKLIRLWIAEGFITETKGRSTLEEVAEHYLNELIRRDMLKSVEENNFGRVKRCRVHDTIRDLAINGLFSKKNFGSVCKNVRSMETNPRRLSVIEGINNIEQSQDIPHLRAFLSFECREANPSLLAWISNFRYLAVLELQGLIIQAVPYSIGNLFNLHYLGLRDTKVASLPKSIKKLHNLQTLDLCGSEIQDLPHEIVQLDKLRHLFTEKVWDQTFTDYRNRTGVHLPKGISKLTELQTLQGMEADTDSIGCLEELTQLRSFRIWNVTEQHCRHLCSALSKMASLSFLDVNASDENEFLCFEGFNLPVHLQKLSLKGRLREQTLESLSRSSSENLRNLFMWWSQLAIDPLPYISKSSNLTYLYLHRAFDGNKLLFRSGWFPNLKFLTMRELPYLKQVVIERGTMKRVETIVFIHMMQLDIPQGIYYLNSLKEIDCYGVSVDFRMAAQQNIASWNFNCNIQAFPA